MTPDIRFPPRLARENLLVSILQSQIRPDQADQSRGPRAVGATTRKTPAHEPPAAYPSRTPRPSYEHPGAGIPWRHLLDEFGIESAHVLGASFGGAVAQHFSSVSHGLAPGLDQVVGLEPFGHLIPRSLSLMYHQHFGLKCWWLRL
jgi:hypothetical protein